LIPLIVVDAVSLRAVLRAETWDSTRGYEGAGKGDGLDVEFFGFFGAFHDEAEAGGGVFAH